MLGAAALAASAASAWATGTVAATPVTTSARPAASSAARAVAGSSADSTTVSPTAPPISPGDRCASSRRATFLAAPFSVASSAHRLALPAGDDATFDLGGLQPRDAAASPAGDRLAFAADDDRGGDGRRAVWTAPTDGSALPVRLRMASPGAVAWSPDGTRLAMTDGSTIVVVPFDGTGETVVDVGGVTQGAPVWSPDGSRLAVLVPADGGPTSVRVVSASGLAPAVALPTPIANGAAVPGWASGDRLVYVASTLHLVVAPADGSDVGTPIVGNSSAQDAGPAVSPDGTRVAWAGYRPAQSRWHVYVAPLDGSSSPFSVTPLFGPDGSTQPAWSPDGTQLAVRTTGASTGAVKVGLAESGAPLVAVGSTGPVAGAFGSTPAWSADGTTVAWTTTHTTGELVTAPADGSSAATVRATGFDGVGWARGWPAFLPDGSLLWAGGPVGVGGGDATWSVPIPGGSAAQLGGGALRLEGGNDQALAVSADRRRVAWAGQDKATSAWKIATSAADGTGLVVRSAGGGDQPMGVTLSPDGSHVAWRNWRTGLSTSGVWVAPTDASSAPVEVSTGMDDAFGQPAWSPAGDRLSFAGVASAVAGSQLFVAAADGSGRLAVAAGADDREPPAWSPDGTGIAFVHAGSELWVASVDGGTPATLRAQSSVARATMTASRPAWSPDGTHLAWSVFGGTIVPGGLADRYGEVQVLRADGTDVHLFPGRDPVWSPDGGAVAVPVAEVFGSWVGTVTPGVVLVVTDGGATSTPLQLGTPTPGTNLGPPRWAPDGRQLLWIANDSLLGWDRDSGVVTSWGSGFGDAQWSPDGAWVLARAWLGDVLLLSPQTGPAGSQARWALARHTGTTAVTWTTTADDPACADRPGSAFHRLTPFRLLDSRTPLGGFAGPLGPGAVAPLAVGGVGGIPATATAVMLDLAVTGGTAASFVQAVPHGSPAGTTGSVLFAAGQTTSNLVTVRLSPGGLVDLYNQLGSVDVVADAVGWYDDGRLPAASPAGGGAWLHPTAPVRVLDSRGEVGGWAGAPLQEGETRDLTVAGVAGIPATATAVVANVTVTDPTSASYLRVWPAGEDQPDTATLLFAPGQTVATAAVLPVGAGGAVSFFNQLGDAHVVVDVTGWYDPGPGGAGFHPVVPTRVLDSRAVGGSWGGAPLGAGEARSAGVGPGTPIPPAAVAVVGNLTVTDGTAASYLAVGPTPSPAPTTAALLFDAGQTVPNQVTVGLGTGRTLDLFNQLGSAHVIFDAAGYFTWR